jgi:ubiquinone/menaquinone biosynthesis C-methylase UbiE
MAIKILRKMINFIKLFALYYPYPVLLQIILKIINDKPHRGPKHYVLKEENWIDNGVTKFIQGTNSEKLKQIIKEYMLSIDSRFVVEKKIIGKYFKGGLVIDVGIGHRPRMMKIIKNAMNVNFDVSMPGLQLIKKYYPSGNFVCGDALQMPFANNSFSFIYIGGVIAHIASYKVLLNEIHRVLEPGGYLLLIEANEPSYRPKHFQDHIWNFTIYSLKKIVKENDFDIIESGGIRIFGLENLFNSLPMNIRIKMGEFLLMLGKLFPMCGHEVYILGKKPKGGKK